MPHDRLGQPIDIGDYVVTKPYNRSRQVVGRVASITAAQQCTGQIVWPDLGGMDRDYFGAEDSQIILKSNGEHPGGEPRTDAQKETP